jgi:hypothetical protein
MPVATDSELKALVERGQVEEIVFRGSEATAKLAGRSLSALGGGLAR